MEAITDGWVFACRLIFGLCNLLHKRLKGPPTEVSSAHLSFLTVFWWIFVVENIIITCVMMMMLLNVDEAWAHPVFRDQSASGIRPIRPRVKHKKQTHYIRITSVLCCIRPSVKHKKQTHCISITSVLCCIRPSDKHKKQTHCICITSVLCCIRPCVKPEPEWPLNFFCIW